MSGPVVYSTNTFLKYQIYKEYLNDIHYVWCSECFDSRKLAAYDAGRALPPSACPAAIYERLKSDVSNNDQHSAKIAEQKTSLSKLALIWLNDGKINDRGKKDIIYMISRAQLSDWRPLIYIIPRSPVEGRMKEVPIEKRAGFAVEYIIEDLNSNEFDLIEL